MRTKLLVGCLVLFFAIAISAVAAYFSVIGLAALFAAAFLPVCIMGCVLEGAKLVAAGWLHSNWRNTNVGKTHKAYLVTAIITLMAITSMGIYGYLARAHLEQKAPTAAVQIDIDQKQAQVDQLVAQRDQLLTQQKALNETVTTYLGKGSAAGASQFMRQQRGQQAALQSQITNVNQQITTANVELAPLKKDVAGAEAELGPLKYISKALGLKDPEAAVNLVICMLMFAFDPLAIVLMISGTITIGEWQRERRKPAPLGVDEYEIPDLPTEPSIDELVAGITEENLHPEFPSEPQEAPQEPLEEEPVPIVPSPRPPPAGTIAPEPGLFDGMDPVFHFTVPKSDEPDAKARLVDILENSPNLLEELVEAVDEVRREREERNEPSTETDRSVQWLDPKDRT